MKTVGRCIHYACPRVSDDVRIGTCRQTTQIADRRCQIAYPSVVAGRDCIRRGTPLVVHAERSATLERGDARPLPATQKLVPQAFSSHEGQVVNVADRQVVALVKVGAGTKR